MVKGITRQVYVVRSPDRALFEQAIFILREDAAAVTDEMLLKEAQKAIRQPSSGGPGPFYGPLWALGGGAVTALIWLLTALL
ncbi:MAG: translation initiation factor 2 [Ruminococcaceae bacterium]|nr:translation initiation factor 2 [Oscillospiraceae bacterium]